MIAADLVKKLDALGYSAVATVRYASSALTAVAEYRPEARLMDINLHGPTNGVTAARQIDAQFDVPVIFLTALNDRSTIADATEAEAFGYLIKPAQTGEIAGCTEIARQRYRAIKAAQIREVWLETQLASVAEGVVVIDHHGRIRFVKKGAEAMLERSKVSLLGLPFCEQVAIENPYTGRLPGVWRAWRFSMGRPAVSQWISGQIFVYG